MNKLKYLIFLQLLVSCGPQDAEDFSFNPNSPDKPEFYIDPRFQPIIEEYKQFAANFSLGEGESNKLLRVETASLQKQEREELLGECAIYKIKSKNLMSGESKKSVYYTTITVLDSLSVNNFTTKIVMFHELTHCFYQIGHIDDRVHIMNSYLPYGKISQSSWQTFLRDLANSIASNEASVAE